MKTSLNQLFDVYKKRLRAPEKSVVEAFCEVIRDDIHISIKEASVRYIPATRTIHLSVSGVIKQELKIREAYILSKLKEKLGEKNTPYSLL